MIIISLDQSDKYEKGGLCGEYCSEKYRMNETMNNECIRVSYSDGYINSLLNTKFLLWQWALKHLAHDTHGKSPPPKKF